MKRYVQIHFRIFHVVSHCCNETLVSRTLHLMVYSLQCWSVPNVSTSDPSQHHRCFISCLLLVVHSGTKAVGSTFHLTFFVSRVVKSLFP